MFTDWRADKWHWRQRGSTAYVIEGVICKKIEFSTITGIFLGEQRVSNEFKREAFFHPHYPMRVLVRYIGDSSVQDPNYEEPKRKRISKLQANADKVENESVS